jgi:hypothetical protein
MPNGELPRRKPWQLPAVVCGSHIPGSAFPCIEGAHQSSSPAFALTLGALFAASPIQIPDREHQSEFQWEKLHAGRKGPLLQWLVGNPESKIDFALKFDGLAVQQRRRITPLADGRFRGVDQQSGPT